jgi:hypothetical protein
MIQAEWRKTAERYEPDLIVTVLPQEWRDDLGDLAVAVELRHDEDGPYVVGVAVRRHVLAGYNGRRTDVSPRAVQRLSLAPIIKAALAFASVTSEPPADEGAGTVPAPYHASDWGDSVWATYYDVGHADEWSEAGFEVPPAMAQAGKVLVPRGRPERGKSVAFYRELADTYRAFELQGLSPVKEIARRKRVPENRVHQWVYRARDLKFLPPSPRSRRKETTDG